MNTYGTTRRRWTSSARARSRCRLFDALHAGLEGRTKHALKVWDKARSCAISKWSPVTCADTQSKGNQTNILQYEDQVAVLVELAGCRDRARVPGSDLAADDLMTANARMSHATLASNKFQ